MLDNSRIYCTKLWTHYYHQNITHCTHDVTLFSVIVSRYSFRITLVRGFVCVHQSLCNQTNCRVRLFHSHIRITKHKFSFPIPDFFFVISFLLLRCFWFHRFGALQFTQQAQTRTNHSLTMILIEISTSLLLFFASLSFRLLASFFLFFCCFNWLRLN